MATKDLNNVDSTEPLLGFEPYLPGMLGDSDLGRIESFLKNHFYYPDGW